MRDFFIFSSMRNFVIKTGIIAGLTVLSACNLTQKSQTDQEVNPQNISQNSSPNVSETAVRESMEYLASNELRGRETGTEGIEKAALHIEEVFRTAGIQPYFETYRDSFEVKQRTGYNLVGFLEGNDPELKDEFVILGAHYDHIGTGKMVDGDSIANGANDNAAGTVAVLEMVKYFGREKNNKRSILFTLFSAEEMGLEGARHLSGKLKSEGLDLYTMVNFEMIGIPMEGKDHLAYLTGYNNSNMAEKINEYTGEKVIGFLPEAEQYNLFQRSDNFPFYQEFRVPAQTVSTFDFSNYDYYHHVSDEAHRMNFAHMVNLIEKIIPGITEIANTSEKEIKLKSL